MDTRNKARKAKDSKLDDDIWDVPERKTRNHSSRIGASESKGKRKRLTHVKKAIPRIGSCKKKNKTTVSVASMSPCTILNFTDDDGDVTDQPMSLCSIANRINDISCGVTARNSTLLANNDGHVDVDFVPGDISVIQGDKTDHLTIASRYNECTPVKQVLESVPSLKKVTFSNGKVGQKSKIDHFIKPTDANNFQSILKKPYVASDSIENQECDRDITPETYNPTKSLCGTQRRRLSYHPDDDVFPCILLDLPCSKGKKAAVLCGKTHDLIKLDELDSFPTDILLQKYINKKLDLL